MSRGRGAESGTVSPSVNQPARKWIRHNVVVVGIFLGLFLVFSTLSRSPFRTSAISRNRSVLHLGGIYLAFFCYTLFFVVVVL